MVGVVGSSPIAPTNIQSHLLKIKLPDGAVKDFPGPVTVAEVAQSIGPGLAKAALAGKVDGKLVDTSYRIESDAELAIVTPKSPEALEILRHSTSHLMAQAVQELYPGAQVTIGPVIENGFYYDFAYKRPFTPEDLAAIEKKMAELAKADLPVQRKVMPRDEAVKFFESIGEKYKAEIIAAIPSSEPISLYGQGNWLDLCRGPHVPSTGKLKVFKLMRVAGAYWRGDSKNEMLQRIYGTAWATKEEQDAYLKMLEEAEKRDHRTLGTQLDLFHMQHEAPGLVFWHPKGWSLWQAVEQYMRRVYRENGYHEVRAPQILDRSLWEKTGHWENFRENMFTTSSENRDYAVKPMNCPGHILIYNKGVRSYRSEGLVAVAGGRAVHAPRVPRERLPRGARPADPRPQPVGEDRALGKLPREHVHHLVGEPRLRGEADELPRAHPDLQQGRAQLPRPAAALRRVRLLPSQRALGRAARADAGARVRAGRRPHLLHRGADPSRVPGLHGAVAERVPRLRLHRHRLQGRDAAGKAHRLG